MAIGERTPLALLDAAASARMAVGEAITNLAAAPVASLSEVKLSANWMAAAGRDEARQRVADCENLLEQFEADVFERHSGEDELG